MDNKFGRYCKTTRTQLQWKFECVEVCDNFPLGVKTSYRAYCADRVKEIVTDHNEKYGFRCQDVQVRCIPAASESEPAGMYLLQRIPEGEIRPETFVDNARAELDRIVSRVQHQFTPGHTRLGVPPTVNNLCHGDAIVAEWIDFATNIAPVTDDANEYCTLSPLYIPLLKELFTCNAVVIPSHFAMCCEPPSIAQVKVLDSVKWSRRDVAHKRNDPAIHASRKSINGDDNENKRCKQSNISSSDDSDEDVYDYRKLSRLEKSQNCALFDFIDRKFHDVDVDDDDRSVSEGVVVDVVMEKFDSTICFEYSLSNEQVEFDDNEKDHDYIVANYAVHHCQWLDDEHPNQNSSKNQQPQPQPKKWRGYALLEPLEVIETPLLDRNPVLTTTRSRRSTTATLPAEITKSK